MCDDVYDTTRNTRIVRCGNEGMALTWEWGQHGTSFYSIKRIRAERICQWESPFPAVCKASFLSRLFQYHQQEDVG